MPPKKEGKTAFHNADAPAEQESRTGLKGKAKKETPSVLMQSKKRKEEQKREETGGVLAAKAGGKKQKPNAFEKPEKQEVKEPVTKKVVKNVSDLVKADKVKAVLDAHKSYKAAVKKGEVYQASPDLIFPDAQVFFNKSTNAVIVILPEVHDSVESQVQKGAEGVAERVLKIPDVKIAVEEPILYNDTLMSDVGFKGSVKDKPENQSLFEFANYAQGSISHQLYVKQVEGEKTSASRYAAEQMPRNQQRYQNPEINRNMVKNLTDNTTGDGEISVFPVGPDHLTKDYDRMTLDVHLRNAGWKMLAK